ncbi:NADPH:quinone reductase [Sanguibacter gelidistatuariae]|uniref:NADPH:quinone reductase n=2 Tax=Sanguibacter gelidistatuariae TaxID=1814289 RepID=A0A1G6XMV3_9MICO|nr:NADPH:quinone reductase [Sanguibacter gelidistatuariae]
MRAIVQHRYGSAGALHLEQVPRPEIADNEVLVQVHAAGLSRGTWHLMTGRPYVMRLALGFRGPKEPVIGQDLAGTVVGVGSAATRFSIGDEVFGIGQGSFAEYAPAREDKLARKPANVTFEQAASVPVSALTALQGLRDVGRVAPGQKVLIVGASGGVGTFSVQLAKAFGAEVTGVCSTAKLDLVRSLGADHVVDYTTTDFAQSAHCYDLILDIGGDASLTRLRRALTHRGTLVIVGGEQGGSWIGMSRQLRAVALSPLVHQRLATFIATQNTSDLERLTDLIETGAVSPTIDRTFRLEQMPDAMRYLEAGHARGKVAIAI